MAESGFVNHSGIGSRAIIVEVRFTVPTAFAARQATDWAAVGD